MRHRETDFDPLFDGPFPLVPNPDAPGQNLVRIEGTKARHLTQGEGRYFELVENLSDVSPYERDVMICVAGELAQRKFVPGTFEDYMADTDWEDAYESASSLAEKQGVDPLEIRANVTDRVNKLLGDPWVDCAVKTLATELLERETLSGSEVVTVLRSVFVERTEPCDG